MANGPGLSTAKGGEVYVGKQIRESVTKLDVLYANQFEREHFTPELNKQTEENFYRGAPPIWLNLYISEQAESGGAGTQLIKRDGYDALVQQIQQSRKCPAISTVKLFHQPGCGGTTLAMQVMWDVRKTFRCAVFKGSTSDMTTVAKEVVQLFTAGSLGFQNTVLLLLNDEQVLEDLQEAIMEEIEEDVLVSHMPVVVFFCCVRKNIILQGNHVALKKSLSDTEKTTFDEKKDEISKKFADVHEQFHGFNILQSNFSEAHVRQVCSAGFNVLKANKKPKTHLATFLALLNAYAPGSYVLESQCLNFLKQKESASGDDSLEDRLKPFSQLIITFQQDSSSEKRVRMAHSMIAQSCTELMAEAGVTRSDTARNFINYFCRDEVPSYLLGFLKHMLTKREEKKEENPSNSPEMQDEKEKFSRLILDIQKMEDEAQCTSLLKVASNHFDKNALFPQTLARFYYLELRNYNLAELWAKEAKQRDPLNSFIADTLGQVHKNHLKNKEVPTKPREILQLAAKAVEAFKHEEQLAEDEYELSRKKKRNSSYPHILNTRGQFGYLQVCNMLYDLLVSQNGIWREVLTSRAPMSSVVDSLRDNKLYRFNDLIKNFRDEVERKYKFFAKFLTYSKPSRRKDDAPYILNVISSCCKKYVQDVNDKHDVTQKLRENLADNSTGVLSCLDRECSKLEVKHISAWWEETYANRASLTALVNSIFAHIMLINAGERFVAAFSQKHLNAFKLKLPLNPDAAPELHMLALILHWPRNTADKCVFDISQFVRHMCDSYENSYRKRLGSRYLRPLFFMGKGEGPKRVLHRKVLEGLFLRLNKDTKPDWSMDWGNEKMFQNPAIQDELLKIEGVVRNYRLYTTVDETEIEVNANLRNNLWKQRQVFFNLGFTIRGPVAFGIKSKTGEQGSSESWTPGAGAGKTQDSSVWTKLKPDVSELDRVDTYSLQSEAGCYECSVSALRWVCKEKISFTYRFCKWEEHMEEFDDTEYMAAGPLLDITVTAGRMEEVHLPHWIDCDSTMSDLFAVLHLRSSGFVIKPVPGFVTVTSSHIKLVQPVFSRIGALIKKKLGMTVKVFYDVLIYKTSKAALTLHVYLVPPDPGLQQSVKKDEESDGAKRIHKPMPTTSLQMEHYYILSASSDTAEISPEKMKLMCERRNQNFFEVFIRNARTDFELKLEVEQKRSREKKKVWSCTIRTGDYQNRRINCQQGQHFIDRHLSALIDRVSSTGRILDKLVEKELISSENYDAVRTLKTTQDQMRDILKFVSSAGTEGKDTLHEILVEMSDTRLLVSELEGSD